MGFWKAVVRRGRRIGMTSEESVRPRVAQFARQVAKVIEPGRIRAQQAGNGSAAWGFAGSSAPLGHKKQ